MTKDDTTPPKLNGVPLRYVDDLSEPSPTPAINKTILAPTGCYFRGQQIYLTYTDERDVARLKRLWTNLAKGGWPLA